MRLRSDILASAIIRQANSSACFAALRRRGSAEAGQILIKVDELNGRVRLFGPPPPDMDSDRDSVRRFAEIPLAKPFDPLLAEQRLAREAAFDPDAWIVEIEDRGGKLYSTLFEIVA